MSTSSTSTGVRIAADPELPIIHLTRGMSDGYAKLDAILAACHV